MNGFVSADITTGSTVTVIAITAPGVFIPRQRRVVQASISTARIRNMRTRLLQEKVLHTGTNAVRATGLWMLAIPTASTAERGWCKNEQMDQC